MVNAVSYERFLGLLLSREGDLTIPQKAYILATVRHETNGTFDPVEEAYWLSDKARKQYYRKMYEGRADLGNTEPGDGVLFHGRGHIQLTGRRNYAKVASIYGKPLVGDPDLILDDYYLSFDIAVTGMSDGWFTGKKLANYINEDKVDRYNARRVVNGLDQASKIAAYAMQYESMLRGIRAVHEGVNTHAA